MSRTEDVTGPIRLYRPYDDTDEALLWTACGWAHVCESCGWWPMPSAGLKCGECEPLTSMLSRSR
jgi:hypothetical protein